MARKGDGKPRSEARRASVGLFVRLTPEEHATLQGKVDALNADLPPDAPMAAFVTIQRLLVAAALRREIRPAPPRVIAAPGMLVATPVKAGAAAPDGAGEGGHAR